ncbi:MAG TPA: flagellar biosynthesis protein FlhF [Methylococcaceae bacterium]|nr:flagellar biosynthesis protein FlhF [Methylococcaceae bacterium]
MKIKRYVAPDMRTAIRMVREDQGPDAVILSNRRVEGGVEIVAALDYDERAFTAGAKEPAARPGAPGAPPAPPTAPPARPAAAKSAAPLPTKENAERKAGQRVTPWLSEPPAPRPAKPAPRPVLPVETKFAAGVETRLLDEVRRELRDLRRTVDLRLAEAGWSSVRQHDAARLELMQGLAALGFSRSLSRQVADRTGAADSRVGAWEDARQILARRLPVHEDTLLEYGGVAALVGPTGVGKTTSVAKLAARFRLKHGPRQIALVTVDNYRIAAHEQLHTYGRILDVPVASAANAAELDAVLKGFMDKKLVLIDTAGMGQRDMRVAEQIALLRNCGVPVRIFLALSAAAQRRTLDEIARAYQSCAPKGCILTKLDEAAELGTALSAVVEHELPLSYVTDGQQVPEDLHRARAANLVERCFAARREDEDNAVSSDDFEAWAIHAGA